VPSYISTGTLKRTEQTREEGNRHIQNKVHMNLCGVPRKDREIAVR
jgi:hypothetical protein